MFNTLGAFLRWAEQSFIDAKLHFGHGTNNAWDEAVAIALFVLGLPPDIDASVLKRPLSKDESDRLQKLAEKRVNQRIPVPYLSHTAWFAGLPFYVNEQVLIPRSPLAELIEQQFSPWLSVRQPMRILDLCAGSGCIAVAVAKAFPEAAVDAIDIDENALKVAKMNIVRHGVENQVQVIKSDLFAACQGRSELASPRGVQHELSPGIQQEFSSGTQKELSLGVRYDIIISNPPYVAQKEIDALPKEYSYEPMLALEAGDDGLNVVRRILKEAPQYLAPKGLLIVEVGSSESALIDEYPSFPFIWLEFERGGEGVFLLREEEAALWKVS